MLERVDPVPLAPYSYQAVFRLSSTGAAQLPNKSDPAEDTCMKSLPPKLKLWSRFLPEVFLGLLLLGLFVIIVLPAQEAGASTARDSVTPVQAGQFSGNK